MTKFTQESKRLLCMTPSPKGSKYVLHSGREHMPSYSRFCASLFISLISFRRCATFGYPFHFTIFFFDFSFFFLDIFFLLFSSKADHFFFLPSRIGLDG